jgi:transcriptional regulator with XRE-family HTH domain
MPNDPSRSHRLIFAERLRSVRKARGFRTAKSFAAEMDIDQNTYTRYERGEVEPNLSVIERMWSALGLTGNELFGSMAGPISGAAESRARGVTALCDPGLVDGFAGSTASTAAAWRLAEAWAETRAGNASAGDPLQRLVEVSRVYQDLADDPYGAVGRLLARPEIARFKPAQREVMATLITAFTATVAVDEPQARGPHRR